MARKERLALKQLEIENQDIEGKSSSSDDEKENERSNNVSKGYIKIYKVFIRK